MSNFKDLLEQIREQDSVQVPDIVKFNVEYRKSIQPLYVYRELTTEPKIQRP